MKTKQVNDALESSTCTVNQVIHRNYNVPIANIYIVASFVLDIMSATRKRLNVFNHHR